MRLLAATGAVVAFAAAVAPAHAAAPKVAQLVVFKNGSAVQKQVVAAKANVKLGKKRCAVGAGTPLAALVKSSIGAIQLHDYGSCSGNPADAAGLYVRRIRKDGAKGVNGWVYKVGNKVAPAGAGDPTGPFGNGRLKPGARITWFYCHMGSSGCQRTLALKAVALGGGQVRVTVRAYDNSAKSRAAAGATVHVRGATAKTDSHGVATLSASPGSASVYAQSKGLVRSYTERIDIT
ncbi:MAG: hypothetical protein QOF65_2317 [Thermoleophilaceae bacterium]|nr:hypothetical protein [Thermoleophilaceae bacterium]